VLSITAAQPPVDYLEGAVEVLFERCMRIQGEGGFPGRGLLQSFELAFKQACRHKMPATIVEADLRILSAGTEIHQKQVIALREEPAPIRRFQCGTGDDGGGSRVRQTPQSFRDNIQPRRTICVIQRNTSTHFFYVSGRVQIVALDERPAESPCQRNSQCRFSGARHAHNHHYHSVSAFPFAAMDLIASNAPQ